MTSTRPRILIPRNAEELLKLAQLIQAKDAELGSKSPLTALEWTKKAEQVSIALAAHNQAEALRRQMEIAYEQRDNLVEEITEWVRQSRDILTGIYRQEIQKLGDFGFTVDTTPRPKDSSVNPTGGK